MKVITRDHKPFFSNCKTLNYLQAILALKDASEKKADDAIYLLHDEILEATTSNFFAIKDRSLITSNSDQIVRGITRQVVLNLASKNFLIEERKIHVDEISTFDEAFLTATNKGVLPISQIDSHRLKSMERTRELESSFSEYTKQDSWDDITISRSSCLT